MNITKAQSGLIAAIAVAFSILPIIQHQQKSKLQNENTVLRSQLAQIDSLSRENQRLSNLLARANPPASAPGEAEQTRELMKLRGEVGVLRKTVNEAASAPKPDTTSPLSGLTQTPEMWKMLRDQQKMGLSTVYRGFGKQANLPAEKLDQLNNLLADNVMTNINHITTCLRDGKSAEEMEELFAEQEAQFDTTVKSLLGDEAFNGFKEYTRNLLSSLSTDQFKSMLQGDKTAKDAAAKQILAAMQQETQRALLQAGLSPDYQTIPTLNFRNFASEQEGEKNLQLLDSIYEQVQIRMPAFLSPEEVEKFGEFRKRAIDNNRLAVAVNRKLMAPPGK